MEKYSTDNTKFTRALASISKSTATFREGVQDALKQATYLCIKNSGGTTPFQQILDTVGGAAHRQGILTWMESFAPVRMVKDKIVLHKDNWTKLDKDSALADFDLFMEQVGANAPGKAWYQIAKAQNTTTSTFNADNRIDSLIKALATHELAGLAAVIRKAVEGYKAGAAKAA